MKPYLSVRGHNWQQEHYETGSPDIRKRASQLRKLGFKVVTSNLGLQVTDAGTIKMTMLSIDHNGQPIPEPDQQCECLFDSKDHPNGQCQARAMKLYLRDGVPTWLCPDCVLSTHDVEAEQV